VRLLEGARAKKARPRELTTAMAVAYYRLEYTVTALETLRHQRELLEAAVQLSTTRYATGPRLRAIPSRQSWPAIACDPKSWHWRASESPRSPQ